MDVPSNDVGPARSARLTRRGLLGAAAGGLALAGASWELDAAGSPSSKNDRTILTYALSLELLQERFYSAAVTAGDLSPDLLKFARVAAGHEVEHVRALRSALGSSSGTPPEFRFGTAVTDDDAFADAAIKLEDLAVSAYNGVAGLLTKPALGAAAEIISVDARHAAWIRAIRGLRPSTRATDPALTQATGRRFPV
jgi:Ferritin-like domain